MSFPTTSYKMKLIILLFATFPLISCDGLATADQDSKSNHHHRHQPHHRAHHHHQQQLGEESSPPVVAKEARKDWELNSKDGIGPQLFAGYSESYITKKAAMELFDKMKHFNRPITEDEYNELLQKIVIKPKSDSKYSIYNKKYYDYLPTENGHVEEEEALATKVAGEVKSRGKKKKKVSPLLKPIQREESIDFEPPAEHEATDFQGEMPAGKHRTKRNSPNERENHEITKRQTGAWSNRFIQNERQHVARFDSFPNTNYYYQQPRQYHAAMLANQFPFVVHHQQQQQQQQQLQNYRPQQHYSPQFQNPNDPWGNRFYSQRPSNYYLPVPPPPEYHQFVIRPQHPFMRFPIPGVVYNVPCPPKNPQILTQPDRTYLPTKPSPDNSNVGNNNNNGNDNNSNNNEQGGPNTVDSRFGDDTDMFDNDRFIFDVEDRRPAGGSSAPAQPPSIPRFPTASTTRRPPPPLIKNDDYDDEEEVVNTNSIFVQQRPNPSTRPPAIPSFRPPATVTQRPNNLRTTTRRPPPPLVKIDDYEDEVEPAPGRNTLGNSNSRPATSRPFFTTTTSRPVITTSRPQPSTEGLSQCVWAIINCCSPSDPTVRYSCFERVGCTGFFLEINPCSEEIVDAAVNAASRYFN